MSEDEKDGQGARGEGAGKGPPREGPEAGPVTAGAAEEDEEERPRITLDRYLGQRRRTPVWSWVHLALLVSMLAALVALLVYKESCGRAVSSFIFMGSPDRGAPVKIQMEPPASRPAPPARP